LLEWLAPSIVGQYRGIETALLAELATTYGGEALDPRQGALPPLAAFMLLSLIRTARPLARIRAGSNPTWVRPSDVRRQPIRDFSERWIARVGSMAAELAAASVVTEERSWAGIIGLCDCRRLGLLDGSVDIVLTSPPYCTRIDYLRSTSFELAALGVPAHGTTYQELRRAAMGTPLARTGPPPEILRTWPADVRELLAAIRRHPSKASRSYYYKTYWQYFSDCSQALAEVHRCLRPGGAAVVVVQSSYYKDLYVDLPQLYLELGRSVGFAGTIVSEFAVQRALAQINTRSLRHRSTTTYREAVLALEKPT
jgi:hypothetical protein